MSSRKCPLSTKTTQTYILVEIYKEYVLVQPLVLTTETYAHKTFEIMHKRDHFFRNILSHFESFYAHTIEHIQVKITII